jgi:hypothetical protein
MCPQVVGLAEDADAAAGASAETSPACGNWKLSLTGWPGLVVSGVKLICPTDEEDRAERASSGFIMASRYSAIFRDCSNMLRPV